MCSCDFSKTSSTAAQVIADLKELSFVQEVKVTSTKDVFFDQFMFPVTIMHRRRVIMLSGTMVGIEKRLIERMGSAGAAIMFEEGRTYGLESVKGF